MPESLSLAQARRIALAAAGFADPAPTGAVTRRHLRRVLDRVGLLQIDSVNVLQRAHYLPLYSRLGGYPTELLDRAAWQAPRELFEYWGHEASLLPVRLHPLLRWRMASANVDAWGGIRQVILRRPDLVSWVLQQVRERGPITAAEVGDDTPRTGQNWGWNWSDAKKALEWLFWTGQVCAAHRTGAFARAYDLPERVLPAEVVNAPTPSTAQAHRELLEIAAAALGVAAESELYDYFRLRRSTARPALDELVAAGTLAPVRVQGWRQEAYLHTGARIPARASQRVATVLSPFDPLIWARDRTERLFGFRYRIEIYTPAHKREHGYYVLPFLFKDQIVARLDLKADRRNGRLLVPGAWIEPGHGAGEVSEVVAAELLRLAEWLALAEVAKPERGDLADRLGEALGKARRGTVVP